MEYQPEIKEPTVEQAQHAVDQFAVAKKAMTDAEKTLKHFARSNGGFSHKNVHVWETATLYKEMPHCGLAAQAIMELFGGTEGVIEGILAAALEKIDNRSLKGFLKGLDGWEYIIAKMAALDPEGEGGCRDVVGSYSLDIRGSAPDLAKVVVKEPGDEG